MKETWQYLDTIKTELKSGSISASDAIIKGLVFLRQVLPSERLLLLNRELLGYLDDEVVRICLEINNLSGDDVSSLWTKKIPIYRVLRGTWVPLATSELTYVILKKQHGTEFCFYSEGLISLEERLEELKNNGNLLCRLSLDPNGKATFVVHSQDLLTCYEYIREQVANLLQSASNELRLLKRKP
jgi:hypothetical protein